MADVEVSAIPLGDDLESDEPGRLSSNPLFSEGILLRVGFAVRLASPRDRCAFTAPFHLFLLTQVVYFLWHFPSPSQFHAYELLRRQALTAFAVTASTLPLEFGLSCPPNRQGDRRSECSFQRTKMSAGAHGMRPGFRDMLLRGNSRFFQIDNPRTGFARDQLLPPSHFIDQVL
jgi:hypothetical protein